MSKIKCVKHSHTIMTQLVMPIHTNSIGTVFGGTVMSWIDIVGAISAQRHSNCEVVTASIDQLNFVAPIRAGWVVNLLASVNYTSRTSMEIGVRVEAENPRTSETFHTASAYLTFVALGSDGKGKVVPPIHPETDAEKRRFTAAQKRREQRLENRAKEAAEQAKPS